MYFNQTDIVHLKSLNIFLTALLLNIFLASLCCAEKTAEVPIKIKLSERYNQVIKLNLSTMVINATALVNDRGIRITDVIINDGRCRTNSKRRRLLPITLSHDQSLKIGLMLGCQVEKILVLTKNESNVQSWRFLVNGDTGKFHASQAEQTFIGET